MGAEDTGEAAAEPAGLARPTAGSNGRQQSAPQLMGLVSGGNQPGLLVSSRHDVWIPRTGVVQREHGDERGAAEGLRDRVSGPGYLPGLSYPEQAWPHS